MNRQILNLAGLCAAAIFIATATGCGGSGSDGGTRISSATPSPPEVGNYQGGFTGSSNSTGVVLITANANDTLNISVSLSTQVGLYTGIATIQATDTFTTTLTNSANGKNIVANGTTYSNEVKLDFTGAVSARNVVAVLKGQNNPFATSYVGTIGGGSIGASQPLFLLVTSDGGDNATGTMTNPAGRINITGTLTSTGVFTAAAPYSVPSGEYMLTGTFTAGAGGKPFGSGVWTDSLHASNKGTWTVKAQYAPG